MSTKLSIGSRCILKTRVLKNAFKHSCTVECGNRLRVGVRAKNASVSGPVGVCVSALLRREVYQSQPPRKQTIIVKQLGGSTS